MTRIIGGSAGGRRIRTPHGEATRPTSDRVREALFSAVEAEVGSLHGLRFLDLYAGSGAVGLEAASRGAATATLVEQDRRAAALVGGNARSLGLSGVEVRSSAVSRVLARPPAAPYDVVYLDPPYPLDTRAVVTDLTALVRQGWLADGALVVVERSSRSPDLPWPRGLTAARSRRYGETTLWYGHADSATRETTQTADEA